MRVNPRSIGFLALAVVAGCQAEPALPVDDPGARNADIEEALAALPDVEVLDRAGDGVPRFVVGSLAAIGAPVEADQAAADQQLKAVLGAPLAAFRLRPDELVLVREHTDDGGTRHFRYRQVRDGLEVVGSQLLVHVDAAGTITGINGTARGDLDPELGKRAISEERALEIAAADPRLADLTVMTHRLVYVQPSDGGSIYQAYELVLASAGDDDRHLRAFVDVDRAAVAEVQDLVKHLKSRDVHDAEHTTSPWWLPGPLRRSEHGSVTSDDDVNAVFDNLGITYDAFAQLLQRDSYDNAGGKITASAHWGTNECQAKFTYYFVPSQLTAKRMLVFGDGSGSGGNCGPMGRPLDVVAHELTHWVTYAEGDLNSSGEPAAIDESLSDIFAAVVEAWAAGGQSGPLRLQKKTWTVGEDARPGGFRDMCRPARFNEDDMWTPDVASHEEHAAAGVGNLAFCLLTRGGSHPTGRAWVNVTGIGMLDAAAIFYKAQRDYMVPNTNYAMLRTATEQATIALGFGAQELRSVRCAWAAVGVGTASPCGTTDIIWRATSTGAVSVWTMNGAGATGSVPGYAAGYQLVGTGDFSGDGRADILWRSMSTGGLAIWRMNGGTRLGDLYPTSPTLAWEAVAVGDFDGGGLADILWREPVTGAVAAWFMHGATKVGETQPTVNLLGFIRKAEWTVAAVGDFNADGISDVLWRKDNGEMQVWLMNGTADPQPGVGAVIAPDWVIAGAGDFDRDGTSDILWRAASNGQVAIWYMRDGNKVGEWYPGAPSLDWQIRGVGDFNADGKSDILWRNNGGANAIWLGGDINAAIYPTGAGPDWKIAATGQLD